MLYIEMARDTAHGGEGWAFQQCLWAPTHKKGNAGSWPFWSKVLQVKRGDIVLHRRGERPNAAFVGYSVASEDGYETTRRPPEPGDWGYATSFYRADLTDFTPFSTPENLDDIFTNQRDALEEYLEENRKGSGNKQNLFYTHQSGRLQCLNGAYISDANEKLLAALFGSEVRVSPKTEAVPVLSVQTGSQFTNFFARVGQQRFSALVKNAYGNRCCFPSCVVNDPKYLVGSHIARWADNKKLRGHLCNGLCLCLMHDRAFEIGDFTLDKRFCVYVNTKKIGPFSPVMEQLALGQGQRISLAETHPCEEALQEHRSRVGIDPMLAH